MEVRDLPEKIRAFVAIRVDEQVVAALADFIEQIRSPRDGVSWTPRDNLHVTLKFLGAAIDSQKIAPLAESLSRIAGDTPALEVHTRGLGGFPDLRRPRVLWTGLECAALERLVARIEDAARAAGFDPSERPWSPHLTIGRVRDPRKARRALKLMDQARAREFGTSRVSQVALYRSHLSSEGSVHELLAAFPLVAR